MGKSLTERIGRGTIIMGLGLIGLLGLSSGCLNDKVLLGTAIKGNALNAKNNKAAYNQTLIGDALVQQGANEPKKDEQRVDENDKDEPKVECPKLVFAFNEWKDNGDGYIKENECIGRKKKFKVGEPIMIYMENINYSCRDPPNLVLYDEDGDVIGKFSDKPIDQDIGYGGATRAYSITPPKEKGKFSVKIFIYHRYWEGKNKTEYIGKTTFNIVDEEKNEEKKEDKKEPEKKEEKTEEKK